MIFPRPRTAFWSGTSSSEILSSPKNRVLEQDKYLRNPPFLWVSEVTLGTFSSPFLRLLRPSLPWCFPVRGLWFCAVFPRPRTAFWSGTSSFTMGFRIYGFLRLLRFTAMVFPCPGAVVLRGLSSPKNRVLERDK